MQVLLEAMPSSWVAWSGHLAAAVDGIDEARLWPLADALTLPRALSDAAVTHAVLELIAPQELQSARTLAYFTEAKKVPPADPLRPACPTAQHLHESGRSSKG